MNHNSSRPPLTTTRWGSRRFDLLPADEELEIYYRDQYYQQGLGSYAVHYSEEDLRWKRLREWLIAEKAVSLSANARTHLDIGCGEGVLLAEFKSRGFDVLGLDFSDEGMHKLHPELLPNLRRGNIMQQLEEITAGPTFDIVSCINLLEHVRSPEEVLTNLHAWMPPRSLLVATVPNDASPLHTHLTEQGIVPDEWWVYYPDHISYFNKDSMTKLLRGMGFTVCGVLADNPIDLNLLNGLCNYIANPKIGPLVHQYRKRTDLFLAGIDPHKLLRLYEAYADLGVGRNLTYYCTPTP